MGTREGALGATQPVLECRLKEGGAIWVKQCSWGWAGRGWIINGGVGARKAKRGRVLDPVPKAAKGLLELKERERKGRSRAWGSP